MSDAADRAPDLLPAADRALVRTVDGLDDAAWAAPSLLPGWTRAHVVAHLALNAEGLAGVLEGARRGRPRPMYASTEARDSDIEDLATAAPAELRDRFLASTTRFEQALAAMRDGDWTGRFERTPGGPEFALVNVALMRVREVEIHHADLDAGYTAADWPEGFRTLLLDSMTRRPYPAPFVVRPTDLDGTWEYGRGRDEAGEGRGEPVGTVPVVTGPSAAAGWWLTGRGTGEGLTSDTTELPEVETW